MDYEDGKTPYHILGLEPSSELDETAIKKAYRMMAIKKHPDKNPNNPNAAAEFAELEQAYRVLTDSGTRGALDDYLLAKQQRKERHEATDAKRRKMKEDLERRERQVATERSEEHIAKQRMMMELEKLRRKMEAEESAKRQQAAAAAAAAVAARGTSPMPGASTESLNTMLAPSAAEIARRTLKVTWDPSTRAYTSEELRAVFGALGKVDDVAVRSKVKKRKASALVVMASEDGAAAALNSVCGDPSDPLLVVLARIKGPGGGDDDDADEAGPGPGAAAAAAAAVPTASAGTNGSFNFATRPASAAATPVSGSFGGIPRPEGAASAASASGVLGGSRPPTGPPLSKPLFPSAPPMKPLFPSAASQASTPAASPVPTPDADAGAAGSRSAPPSVAAGPARSFPGFPPLGKSLFPSAAGGAAGSSGGGLSLGGFSSFPGMPGSAGGAAGGGTGRASTSLEDQILERMRQAAEAKKAAAASDGDGASAGAAGGKWAGL